ncbi:hypothetical protein [Pedobacter sp. Hv1]|uniref:hypothetical protein n=1 Tax=Pedobacter sp. Hv1 TaxID=1740090 RepID=UPI0006D8977F|nr:hypothetical protein [Pedobacter sp. Hv1]KQC02756.1 hypothetical protein AQF98_04055 [Pedobacter sp. Hv1]
MKMYHISKSILVLIWMCCIISCKNKEETDEIASLKSVVENTLGKKLIIPASLPTYSPFTNYIADSAAIFNSEYRIYSKVNASCGSCITHINLWKNLIAEFSKYKIPVILVCNSDDQFELIKYFCETGKLKSFSYPFFLDRKNEFVKKNKFMAASKNFETVLTDKNNTILLLGNPAVSKAINKLYLKEIQKRINKD